MDSGLWRGRSLTKYWGSNVPVRGQATVDRNGNPISSIEYKQAGIILELEPRIYESSIQLAVHQQISSVSVTNTSGIDSPTLNTREVDTVVDLADGEIVLLGGLDNSVESNTSSGLEFLPTWLKSATGSKNRNQVILL